MKRITYLMLSFTLILVACSKDEEATRARLNGKAWWYQELEVIQEDAPCFILEEDIPLENTSVDMYLDESEPWSWWRQWRYSKTTTTDANGNFSVNKPMKKYQFRLQSEDSELNEIGCNGSSSRNSNNKYFIALKKKKIRVNLEFHNLKPKDKVLITFKAKNLNRRHIHRHNFEESVESISNISFQLDILERINYQILVNLNGNLVETFSYYSSSFDDEFEKSISL